MGGRGSSSGLSTQAGAGGASAKGAGSGTIMAEDPRIKVAEAQIKELEAEKQAIESQYAPGQKMTTSDRSQIDKIDEHIALLKVRLECYKTFPDCSDSFVTAKEKLFANKIDERKVSDLSEPMSEQDIIDRIAGGDLTQGSCASVAWAYIGNEHGIEVYDFRGGISLSTFSKSGFVKNIAGFNGVKSDTSDYPTPGAFIDKLKSLEKGKEYYAAIAKHAAIVKNTDSGPMYLELQDYTDNGWKPLNKAATFKDRFGWTSSVASRYKVVGRGVEGTLVDVGSLKGSNEFKHILGYLNTAVDKQQKGSGGYAK